MMKKIIILIAALLVISGCIPTFSGIKEKIPGQPTGKTDFIGGTKGIEIEILNPLEGGKAYSDQPFNIAVRVSNKGESYSEGTTCVSGLNTKYFPGFSGCDCQDFMLEGKRKIEEKQSEGEEETLIFETGQITTGELKNFAVTASTRYEYKTFGIIKACIKKDAYSKEGCQISPQKNILKSASSAPLTIEKVTQEIIPETDETSTIIFNINLKKSGKGDLYSMDEDMSQCENPQDLKRKINLRLINAPGRSTCDPAELRKGKDEVTAHCTVNNVKVLGESYESEITLELEYAYETIESNKFEVV